MKRTFQIYRYDPDKDARLVALGGGGALAAALRNRQIDAFQLSPPIPEQLEADGVGVIVISAALGDVPELIFPYEVLVARKDFVDAYPDTVRAVARANNFLIQNPVESARLIQPFFPNIRPQILARSLLTIAQAVKQDGLMDRQGWDNLVSVLGQANLIRAPMDTREGLYWTNEFVRGLNGQAD